MKQYVLAIGILALSTSAFADISSGNPDLQGWAVEDRSLQSVASDSMSSRSCPSAPKTSTAASSSMRRQLTQRARAPQALVTHTAASCTASVSATNHVACFSTDEGASAPLLLSARLISEYGALGETRRRAKGTWRTQIMRLLTLFLIALAFTGALALYSSYGTWRVQRHHPPVGQFVDAAGLRLHNVERYRGAGGVAPRCQYDLDGLHRQLGAAPISTSPHSRFRSPGAWLQRTPRGPMA